MKTQTQLKYEDICRVTIEVPKSEDLIKALKWLLGREKVERDLDIDSAIKITYFSLALCADTQCYKTFDRFDIVKVEHAEIAKFSKKIDERRWENTVIVIPRKFANSSVVLKHESELSVHYHIIYRTGVVEGAVNGWKETIVFERLDP